MTRTIGFQADERFVEALDKVVQRLRDRNPGHTVSRSDVLRQAVQQLVDRELHAPGEGGE